MLIFCLVKANTAAQDWRTVIYMSVDTTPPNADPKHTSDVNTLPYSYSLTAPPILLRDGPDTPTSKYYTIPATPNTPYPTLPISLPDMAMYLASAVKDSQTMVHDKPSGIGRLAEYLAILYPPEAERGVKDDAPESYSHPKRI